MLYVENLAKLRDFLIANEVPFDMQEFRMDPEGLSTVQCLTLSEYENGKYDCGTAACAVGWAPFVIAPKPEHFHGDPAELRTWTYVSETLIEDASQLNRHEFDWAFGSQWVHVDNTRQGAAFRIDYLIKHNDAMPEFRASSLEKIEYRNYQSWVDDYFQARNEWLTENNIPFWG